MRFQLRARLALGGPSATEFLKVRGVTLKIRTRTLYEDLSRSRTPSTCPA
jgi:hypothetical protein